MMNFAKVTVTLKKTEQKLYSWFCITTEYDR